MKYGFIGAGNICTAVVTGAVKTLDATEFSVFDTDAQKCEQLAKATGIGVYAGEEIAAKAGIIFFGLKPNVILDALAGYREILARRADVVVVSFAAGVEIEQLNAALPGTRLLRVLPNLNAAVGAGMAAVCANSLCSAQDIAAVEDFLSACGSVVAIEEKYFDLFTVLAGSTPAFTYLFIDSLARAGLKLGMDKRRALMIAAQSVLGSAKMLLEADAHPWELIDRVCSPGGLTIEGICTLQEHAFESAVEQAIQRSVAKNTELRK